MGWTAHVILEVRGDADAVEVFRASFSEFWVAYAFNGTTTASRYFLPGTSLPPVNEAILACEEGIELLASKFAHLRSLQPLQSQLGPKSLARIALERVFDTLCDLSVPKSIKDHIWDQILPDLREKMLTEVCNPAQLDELLHNLLIMDPFWRHMRSNLLEILRHSRIQGHLFYEANLSKWELIDEVGSYASRFPTLDFTLTVDREIAFKGVLRWSGGRPEFGDDYWDAYSDEIGLPLDELTLQPVDLFFPKSEGWRSFHHDVMLSADHLIFASPSALGPLLYQEDPKKNESYLDDLGFKFISCVDDEPTSALGPEDENT